MIVSDSWGGTDTDCSFKRVGRYLVHDCVGRKHVVSKKIWTKKGDGGYGWSTRKQTRYICQNEGIAEFDRGFPEIECEKQTISSLGGPTDVSELGTIARISGVESEGAEANESESVTEIISRLQDVG